jgi:hypothetical protein
MTPCARGARLLVPLMLTLPLLACIGDDAPRTVVKSDSRKFSQLVVSGEWLYFRSWFDDSEARPRLARRGSSGDVEYPDVPAEVCHHTPEYENGDGVASIFAMPPPDIGIVLACGPPDSITAVLSGNTSTNEWREVGLITEAPPPSTRSSDGTVDASIDADACWKFRSSALVDWWRNGGAHCIVPGDGRFPVNTANGDLYYVGKCGTDTSGQAAGTICYRTSAEDPGQPISVKFDSVTGLTTAASDLIVAGVKGGKAGLYRIHGGTGDAPVSKLAEGRFSYPVVGPAGKEVFFLDCPGAVGGCRKILAVDLRP